MTSPSKDSGPHADVPAEQDGSAPPISWRVLGRAIVHTFQILSPIVAIICILGIIAMTVITQRWTSRQQEEGRIHNEAANKLVKWLKENKEGQLQGSEISFPLLFESSLEGFARLYTVLEDPSLSDSAYRQLERAIILLKLPIYKRASTVKREMSNYSFHVLSVYDSTSFADNLTSYRQTLRFHAQYNPQGPPLLCDTFKLYLEPSINSIGLDSLDLDVQLIRGRDTTHPDWQGACLGVPHDSPQIASARSSLFELRLPLDSLQIGEQVKVVVRAPLVKQEFDGTPVRFSIYDFHTERYRQGIDTLRVALSFGRPVYLQRFCISNGTGQLVDCDTTDIIYSKPPGKLTSNTPLEQLDLIARQPDNLAYAFFTREPLASK